jgi:hypothetical protein
MSSTNTTIPEQLGNTVGKVLLDWVEESARDLQCRNLVKYFQETLHECDMKYKDIGWKFWRKNRSQQWALKVRPLVLQGIEQARKKNLASAIVIKLKLEYWVN